MVIASVIVVGSSEVLWAPRYVCRWQRSRPRKKDHEVEEKHFVKTVRTQLSVRNYVRGLYDRPAR